MGIAARRGWTEQYAVEVEIAEKRDGEALQARGPAAKSDLLPDDSRTVGLEQRGLDGEGRNAGGRREADKLSPGHGEKGQSDSWDVTALHLG